MQSLLFILPIRHILFTNIQKILWIQTCFAYFFVQNKSLLTKTRSNWNLNFIISIKKKSRNQPCKFRFKFRCSYI